MCDFKIGLIFKQTDKKQEKRRESTYLSDKKSPKKLQAKWIKSFLMCDFKIGLILKQTDEIIEKEARKCLFK